MLAAIFLNGSHPSIRIVKKLLKEDCHIIAADGGANYLHSKRINPDVIIGDMDSLSSHATEYYRKKDVRFIRIKEQETTDFEKSLNYCKTAGYKEVIVLGATSNRPDHTMNNFSVMKRYRNYFDVRIFTDEYEIFYASKSIVFTYGKNETLSMMAMPKAVGVSTKGLKYRLNDETLEFGIREGSLNESVSHEISISYKSGTLLIFRKHFIN
jgi:thiamine pyrophosphokinase